MRGRAFIFFALIAWVTPAQAQLFQNLFRIYNGELKELRRTNPSKKELSAEIQKRNLAAFAALPPPPETTHGITKAVATSILGSMQTHPVVGETALSRYDPELEVGFCFGRAVYAHWELLRRRVPARDIRKAFAIGRLVSNSLIWDFHVATITRAQDTTWWAIDGLTSKVLPLEEWMKETQKLDRDPKDPTVRFYFTDANQFLPFDGAYSQKNLNKRLFKGYFKDLEASFGGRPKL